jgi:hypothetical protein
VNAAPWAVLDVVVVGIIVVTAVGFMVHRFRAKPVLTPTVVVGSALARGLDRARKRTR